MAQTLVIGTASYKRRNIIAVWLGLPLLTLGIYHLVWIYKVNAEARHYLRDDSIRPALSVLALVPGFILIVPPFIAIYRLGGRIARMEEAGGVPSRVEPVLGLILSFVFSTHALYYQSHLNTLWDRHLRAAPALPPGAPAAPAGSYSVVPQPNLLPASSPIPPPPSST